MSSPSTSRLTLEQQRAAHAWSKASEGVARHPKDYVNDAKGLPALIMNSGLMQVMAFLHGKGGRHVTLANHLLEWLHQRMDTPKDFSAFMTHLAAMEDARQFQAITTEALAWLKWLRQLAPAVEQ
ncbi:MAG: type III-B CRISPR module-associated protein Cmr5 [Pseudomonadota bacterium]|nr:MAG: type III-B CRISPR module-associated protein Cmr5 [Pseudomonadota bacterium]